MQIAFALAYVITLVVSLLFEWNVFESGIWGVTDHMAYVMKTVGVLLTLLCVPLSLSLFNTHVNKRIRSFPLQKALHTYLLWSYIRLSFLTVVVAGNMAIYYLTLDNTGFMCALIGVIATFFCVPTQKKFCDDLDINNFVSL